MVKKVICLNLIIVNLLFSCSSNAQDENKANEDSFQKAEIENALDIKQRLSNKVSEAKLWLSKNRSYNQDMAIFVDMKIHSGQYRFFVVDLKTDSVLSRGLVAHGSGSNTEIEDSLTFSNVPESYQSSLGKYKIGANYIGSFDKSYKLHGLESSNNKAYQRSIVLHRYSCVPDLPQDYLICNSLGCIMLSENYFLEIDKYISGSSKSILLDVYF